MRAYMAAAIYLLIAVKGKVFHRIKARDIPFFAVYGLCSVTFVYISYLTAIRLLSVSLASVLLFTSPAFVILLSRLFFGEPITRRKVVALALTGIGMIHSPGLLFTESYSPNLGFVAVYCVLIVGFLVLHLIKFNQKAHQADLEAEKATALAAAKQE